MDGSWRCTGPGDVARRARPTRSGWCWPPPTGVRRLPAARPRRWCRPPRRTGWSATSARTCSARTGTPTRRSAGSPGTGEQIGEALLDQRNLAGVGNLYKVEALFLRGVHPWTRVAAVPDLAGTRRPRPRLLRANRAAGAEHHRRPAPGARPLGVRPPRPAVPALRHRHPAGRAGPEPRRSG